VFILTSYMKTPTIDSVIHDVMKNKLRTGNEDHW
jgi:hypothetical protein